MKAAQDRQKSYADLGRKPSEFQVGEKVLLGVSPTRGVMRFGKKGKLSPRFIGPYEILDKVGQVAYRLALPMELDKVHDVFNISQLKKYVHDASHVISPEVVVIDETLSYEETPVKILDFKARDTRRKSIRLVKVLWSNHSFEEATWEVEDDMRSRYPALFESGIVMLWVLVVSECGMEGVKTKCQDSPSVESLKVEVLERIGVDIEGVKRKYVHDALRVIQLEVVTFEDALSYEEKPVRILSPGHEKRTRKQ
ncbi:uncharacterized protein LOC116029756 [Ipomoea triloba]|uniref:uncharacterized protein LOC116029756 n=1 Tax=Ipomoea triloba TaxID=35885 RepID=UPI00125E5A9A|nr:uncharacterized protein LOC116029756 [Ipomoea triloba]